MNHKLSALIVLISFTTLAMSAAANEPAPASLKAPADPVSVEEHNDLSSRLEKVEASVQEHETQLEDHEGQLQLHQKRIARNEAFRLYGTAGFGGLAASGGMFLGYMTALPVLLTVTDHKTTANEIHAIGFATAGTVSAVTTFGMLKMLNASWTTSAVAAGATMGTAMVGMYGRGHGLHQTGTLRTALSGLSPHHCGSGRGHRRCRALDQLFREEGYRIERSFVFEERGESRALFFGLLLSDF